MTWAPNESERLTFSIPLDPDAAREELDLTVRLEAENVRPHELHLRWRNGAWADAPADASATVPPDD